MSLPDLIFIFLLALVILGPKKLPIVAGQLGKWMAEFKRASNEFKNQLETEMMNIELEERAKKDGENAKALSPLSNPTEEPWERMMRPLTDSVSRTKQEFAAMINPEPAKVADAAPPERAPSTLKSAGTE